MESHAVDDKVGCNARFGKGHVFLGDNQSHNTLLSVTGCEFVTDFRDPEVTCPYLDQTGTVLSLGQDDGIDDTPPFVASHGNGGITAFLNGDQFTGRFFKEPGGR